MQRREENYAVVLADESSEVKLLNRDTLTPQSMDNLREVRLRRMNQRGIKPPVAPVEKDTVQVRNGANEIVRVFSLETHGENYKELAYGFVTKKKDEGYKMYEYKEEKNEQ